jgi:arylsulfatase A-like enzyme
VGDVGRDADAADLAGAKAPAGIDGISMVPALLASGPARPHEYLYWEFYEQGTKQAVRADRWKGVRQPMMTGRLELYDLMKDPAEAHDVAAAHPDVAARLGLLMDQAHTPSALWKVPER